MSTDPAATPAPVPPPVDPVAAPPPATETTPLPEYQVSRLVQTFFILMSVFVIGFLAWARIGTLDIVSLTQGEVIPSSHVKEVQHLEGGIVRKILVREGDEVRQGQALVELEPTSSDADVNEITARLYALRLEMIRWESERDNAPDLAIPPEMASLHPDQVVQARSLFHSRQDLLHSKITSQEELVIQREKDIEEIRARKRNAEGRLALLQEQVRISERLLKDDLTNRYNHLELLKEQNTLRGQIEEANAALGRAESGLKGARSELSSIRHGYAKEIGDGLENARRQFTELSARATKFQDSLERTVLRAPVAGVVSAVKVATEGGVIKPGGTVLDLVPKEDKLVVEARLPIQDIGYVRPGQKAVLRLATADAIRFGKLEGDVVHVSADTTLNDKGQPYYKVKVETSRGFFQHGAEQYHLYPGMYVSVQIHTGQRTVLEYLFSPFLTSLDVALTER